MEYSMEVSHKIKNRSINNPITSEYMSKEEKISILVSILLRSLQQYSYYPVYENNIHQWIEKMCCV